MAFCLCASTVLAQSSGGSQGTEGSMTSFLVGVAEGYPWLATVLLIVGGLRVIFKPLMTLIDGFMRDNCTPEEYAKLQNFESGPVYRWINFALDLVGSVKLPVVGVKPTDKTKN